MPLGIMEDTVYEEHVCRSFHPGHVFVLGTDGVWEMPNSAGEQFGKQRLREAIQTASEGNANGSRKRSVTHWLDFAATPSRSTM